MNEKKEKRKMRNTEGRGGGKKKKAWLYSEEYIILEWLLEVTAIQQRHGHSSQGWREEETLKHLMFSLCKWL